MSPALLLALSAHAASPTPTAVPPAAGQVVQCDSAASLAALELPRRYREIGGQLVPGTPLTLVLDTYGQSVLWSRTTPAAAVLAAIPPGVPTTVEEGVLTAGTLDGAVQEALLTQIDASRPGCWIWQRRATSLVWLDPASGDMELWARLQLPGTPSGLTEQILTDLTRALTRPAAEPSPTPAPRTTAVPQTVLRLNQADGAGIPVPAVLFQPGVALADLGGGRQVWWSPTSDPKALVARARASHGGPGEPCPALEAGIWRCSPREYLVQLPGAVASATDEAAARDMLAGVGTPWWGPDDGMDAPGVVTVARSAQGVEHSRMVTVDGLTHASRKGHPGSSQAVPGIRATPPQGYDYPAMSIFPEPPGPPVSGAIRP